MYKKKLYINKPELSYKCFNSDTKILEIKLVFKMIQIGITKHILFFICQIFSLTISNILRIFILFNLSFYASYSYNTEKNLTQQKKIENFTFIDQIYLIKDLVFLDKFIIDYWQHKEIQTKDDLQKSPAGSAYWY